MNASCRLWTKSDWASKVKDSSLTDVFVCFEQMIQLVNKIIYGNIYCDDEEGTGDDHQQPQASHSLREGILLLHRGGLASFRWIKWALYTHTHTHIVVLSAFYVDIMHSLTQWFPTIFGMDPILTSLRSRYEVQLHPGQLTLMPFRRHSPADSGVTSAVPMQIVIHLSDGDTCVQRTSSPDAFALITHKNQYQWVGKDHYNSTRHSKIKSRPWIERLSLWSMFLRRLLSRHQTPGSGATPGLRTLLVWPMDN